MHGIARGSASQFPVSNFFSKFNLYLLLTLFFSNSLPTVADEATTTPDADDEAVMLAEFAANFG